MKRFVIVGGGIAGLSAAYYLQKQLPMGHKISVLEASSYWGGKLITERVNDIVPDEAFIVEGGPDTFVSTKPWGTRLCQELGIADRLVGSNPNTKKTYILKNGELMELPGGLTMMIPTEFGAMLRTRLLSLPAKMRMGMDFFLPPAKKNGDETMAEFVTRRLGRSAYDNLIEPLMSGIYAGDGEQLSLQATLPYLRDLELKYGGLVKGALAVRAQRAKMRARAIADAQENNITRAQPSRGSAAAGSIFLTPMTGLAEIVELLTQRLRSKQVDLQLHSQVRKITKTEQGYQIDLNGNKRLHADGLILATPAYASAELVENFAPHLASELRAIQYSTTATVSLAYRQQDLKRALDGYGYVIPSQERRKALACTWSSTKFPHRSPEGFALLRVFIGRAGQEAEINWNENELLSVARQELKDTLLIEAHPIFTRTSYWEKAMPQYHKGHLERLQRIESKVSNYPRLALAGNGYQGIGIPDCIHSGELAVEKLLKDGQSHTFIGENYEN